MNEAFLNACDRVREFEFEHIYKPNIGRDGLSPALKAEYKKLMAERLRQQNFVFEAQSVARAPEYVAKLKLPPLIEEGLKDFNITALWKVTQEWAHNPKALILVLAGAPGKGKTFAAARWVSDVAKQAKTAMFIQAQKLASDLYSNDGRANWRTAEDSQALVIDDLGSEHASDAFKSQLESLVDSRVTNKRRTAITTNLEAKEFEAKYGPRVGRRVKEFGERI